MIQIRRAETEADLAAGIALHNAVSPEQALSLADARSWRSAVDAWCTLLAEAEGEPVGQAFGALSPERRGQGVAQTGITVLPARRREGIGTALLRELSGWAGEPALTGLEAFVREDDPTSLAWAERQGFAEIGRESLLVLDLAASDSPCVEPPDGVRITTWAERPGLTGGMYEVAKEAIPDVPGEEDLEIEPFEGWLAHDMGGSGDRPEATFVATHGDEVVGYAKFHLTDARPGVAVHDLTGVKRAWRGRGVARALKAAEIAWAKDAGYERLETMNERRNEPIRRLNERFGYRATPGRILVRGPLAGTGRVVALTA